MDIKFYDSPIIYDEEVKMFLKRLLDQTNIAKRVFYENYYWMREEYNNHFVAIVFPEMPSIDTLIFYFADTINEVEKKAKDSYPQSIRYINYIK